MFFKLGVPGVERSSASVLVYIRGHGHRQWCLLDRGRRGRSTVVAIEIHTTLSAIPPFVFVCFRMRRKNKNARRGGTISEVREGERQLELEC
jgi:hypothetical protein